MLALRPPESQKTVAGTTDFICPQIDPRKAAAEISAEQCRCEPLFLIREWAVLVQPQVKTQGTAGDINFRLPFSGVLTFSRVHLSPLYSILPIPLTSPFASFTSLDP